jgi:hypothetical protein
MFITPCAMPWTLAAFLMCGASGPSHACGIGLPTPASPHACITPACCAAAPLCLPALAAVHVPFIPPAIAGPALRFILPCKTKNARVPRHTRRRPSRARAHIAHPRGHARSRAAGAFAQQGSAPHPSPLCCREPPYLWPHYCRLALADGRPCSAAWCAASAAAGGAHGCQTPLHTAG